MLGREVTEWNNMTLSLAHSSRLAKKGNLSELSRP